MGGGSTDAKAATVLQAKKKLVSIRMAEYMAGFFTQVAKTMNNNYKINSKE